MKTYYIKRGNTYERVDDPFSIVGLNKIDSWYNLRSNEQSAAELFESIANAHVQKCIELNYMNEDNEPLFPPFSISDTTTWTMVVYTSSGVKQLTAEQISDVYDHTDENGNFVQGYIFVNADTRETFDTSEIYFCLTNYIINQKLIQKPISL